MVIDPARASTLHRHRHSSKKSSIGFQSLHHKWFSRFQQVDLTFRYNPHNPFTLTMNIIVDIFFLADIVVSFRTGSRLDFIIFLSYEYCLIILKNCRYHVSEDKVVMDENSIAVRYATSWFPLDVISGMPISTLSFFFKSGECIFAHLHPRFSWYRALISETKKGGVQFYIKILKILRCLRILKLVKVKALLTGLDDLYVELLVYNRPVLYFLKFLKIFVISFFIVHYVACGSVVCVALPIPGLSFCCSQVVRSQLLCGAQIANTGELDSSG